MLAFSASASASTATGSVELAWSPSISTNVVGYYIYYGVACREYASSNYVAGAVSTNAAVTGLVPGTTYYFSATAVDSLGNQSPFSNETTYSVPLSTVSITPPTLDPLVDVTIIENNGLETIGLTGITSGGGTGAQTLTVTAVSSNPGLIPNPTVSYTSPNSTGALSFTPAANSYGTAVISVTVNNGGATNNTVAQSFAVIVDPISQLIAGPAPAIQVPPLTQTAEMGSVVTLNSRVTSASPLTYRWLFNGNPLAGCNTNRLCLAGVQPENTGTYTLVVSNANGGVASAAAVLNVITPVPRRLVPAVSLTAQPGTTLGLDCSDAIGGGAHWTTLATMTATNSPQSYYDISDPLPPRRFYRVWKTGTPGGTPAMALNFVNGITLTGTVGSNLRLDCINAIGPTNAWVTIETVTLTNTSQLYLDSSILGQSGRLYRIMPVP
jgi:hypothetical protein